MLGMAISAEAAQDRTSVTAGADSQGLTFSFLYENLSSQ